MLPARRWCSLPAQRHTGAAQAGDAGLGAASPRGNREGGVHRGGQEAAKLTQLSPWSPTAPDWLHARPISHMSLSLSPLIEEPERWGTRSLSPGGVLGHLHSGRMGRGRPAWGNAGRQKCSKSLSRRGIAYSPRSARRRGRPGRLRGQGLVREVWQIEAA
jgi:hypothetical protein